MGAFMGVLRAMPLVDNAKQATSEGQSGGPVQARLIGPKAATL